MQEERRYLSGSEQDQVSRSLLMWLNQYENKPVNRIEFEFLGKEGGMSLSAVTAPYKTEEYITGSYDAQYQFAILYRLSPQFSGGRLNAVEILDTIARWAEERKDKPILGPGMTVTSVQRNSSATMIARYEDNTEDYQILMNLNYEVN